MKKLTIFAALILLVFALSGCSGREKSSAAQEKTIIIKNDGTVLLENKPVTLPELQTELQALQKKYDVSVQIKTEKNATMESVHNVQQVIKSANIGKLTYAEIMD